MEAVFSADGQYLATSVGEQLKIWEVASNSLFQEFSAGGKISCVSWSQVGVTCKTLQVKTINVYLLI